MKYLIKNQLRLLAFLIFLGGGEGGSGEGVEGKGEGR